MSTPAAFEAKSEAPASIFPLQWKCHSLIGRLIKTMSTKSSLDLIWTLLLFEIKTNEVSVLWAFIFVMNHRTEEMFSPACQKIEYRWTFPVVPGYFIIYVSCWTVVKKEKACVSPDVSSQVSNVQCRSGLWGRSWAIQTWKCLFSLL